MYSDFVENSIKHAVSKNRLPFHFHYGRQNRGMKNKGISESGYRIMERDTSHSGWRS